MRRVHRCRSRLQLRPAAVTVNAQLSLALEAARPPYAWRNTPKFRNPKDCRCESCGQRGREYVVRWPEHVDLNEPGAFEVCESCLPPDVERGS